MGYGAAGPNADVVVDTEELDGGGVDDAIVLGAW